MLSFLKIRFKKIALQGEDTQILNCNVIFDDETDYITFPNEALRLTFEKQDRHIQNVLIENCKVLRHNSEIAEVSGFAMVQLATYSFFIDRQGAIPLDYLRIGDTIEILNTPNFEGLRFRILDVFESDIHIGIHVSYPVGVWLLNVPIDNILIRNP